jgi:hypothetical protein
MGTEQISFVLNGEFKMMGGDPQRALAHVYRETGKVDGVVGEKVVSRGALEKAFGLTKTSPASMALGSSIQGKPFWPNKRSVMSATP